MGSVLRLRYNTLVLSSPMLSKYYINHANLSTYCFVAPGETTTEPYLNRQYLKIHIRGLNRMNLVYVVFLLDSSSNHLPFYWQWLYKMWYGVDKGWMPTT